MHTDSLRGSSVKIGTILSLESKDDFRSYRFSKILNIFEHLNRKISMAPAQG